MDKLPNVLSIALAALIDEQNVQSFYEITHHKLQQNYFMTTCLRNIPKMKYSKSRKIQVVEQ